MGILLRSVLIMLSLTTLGVAQAQTLLIDGQNGTVITGRKFTSTSGPCIKVNNSKNITISANDIGSCGQDGSTSDSQGILITGDSTVTIIDNWIHVETQAGDCIGASHDGIFVYNNQNGSVVQKGNVIAYGGSNSNAWNASNITLDGNALINPRGPKACSNPDNLQGNQFHSWSDDASPNKNVTVINNFVWASGNTTKYKFPGRVSDFVGFGVTTGVLAQNNWIGTDGTATVNQYACGLISDYKADQYQFLDNIIDKTYNCGIGLTGWSGKADRNKVMITKPTLSFAQGISVNPYVNPCGTVSLTGNISFGQQGTDWVSGYWNSGACPNVTLSGNTFDSNCTPGQNCPAYAALNPLITKYPPPPIPPGPVDCVAASPLSTNTSKPICGATPPPPPPPPAPTTMLCSFVEPNTSITVTKGGAAVPMPQMSIICK